MQSKFLLILAILVFPIITNAQEKNVEVKLGVNIVILDSTSRPPINPLSPAKAAFYSAILPGLGQAYNKKYWKIPLVYAALGTGVYFYLNNDKEYKRYRDAYKRRLAGFTDDEFYGSGSTPSISNDALIRAQRTLSRNREVSILITIGIYALNIIDANVDAHLLQYNIDENLALKPHFNFNELDATTNLGLTLNFNF
ncbi:hypothetical protein JYU05_01485 [bacterium AH-315-P13]|nr:hypothetical protein [bacterium AH-315-P13]